MLGINASYWSLKCLFFSKLPNTNLESVSEGERDLSAARPLDKQISGFISVQEPTAIVKVEAGIGMVT